MPRGVDIQLIRSSLRGLLSSGPNNLLSSSSSPPLLQETSQEVRKFCGIRPMQSGGANSPVARPHPFLSKAGRQIVQDARASRSRDSAPKPAGPKHRKAAAGGKPAARPPWRHVGGRLAAENQPATPAPAPPGRGRPGVRRSKAGRAGNVLGQAGGEGGSGQQDSANDSAVAADCSAVLPTASDSSRGPGGHGGRCEGADEEPASSPTPESPAHEPHIPVGGPGMVDGGTATILSPVGALPTEAGGAACAKPPANAPEEATDVMGDASAPEAELQDEAAAPAPSPNGAPNGMEDAPGPEAEPASAAAATSPGTALRLSCLEYHVTAVSKMLEPELHC